MRRSRSIHSLLIASVVAISGCSVQSGHVKQRAIPDSALHLKDADPVEDLSLALRRGDTRFVGMTDLGDFVPGAENREDLTSKYGVRMLKDSSCTMPGDTYIEAVEYAQVYNLLLLRHLKQHNSPGH